MYRQKAVKFLGHKKGDFPITDYHAKNIITFPCDQHLSKKEILYVTKTVQQFYS
jgi:dTDP-4-amino-4,6-dideoxygalactose transaminase